MKLESPGSLWNKHWKKLLGIVVGVPGVLLLVPLPVVGGPLLALSGIILGHAFTWRSAVEDIELVVEDLLDGPESDKPDAN